jgi:FdhD protein
LRAPAAKGARRHQFERIGRDGLSAVIERDLAEEVPIALEFNGIGYAVLMATPVDLVDLVYGFALSERLIDRADDLIDVDCHVTGAGTVVRATVRPAVATRVVDRVRHRTTDSSCGLCGIENLEQAMRPLPTVPAWDGDVAAIFAAAGQLDVHQLLNRTTRSVHAAARCTRDGAVIALREDVGRHNAFDKLIGAMLRQGEGWQGGFALLTSRCSFELVEKAALSGCPMLATVSAATALAVERASQAGLALHTIVRHDGLLRAS